MTQRMNSASRIKRYHGPLLQSHGDADRLIPITLARKLHAAAPGKKKFIELSGADHNDPRDESYSQALDAFIDALPPLKPAAPETAYRKTGGLI